MNDYLLTYTIRDGKQAGERKYIWFESEEELMDFVERNSGDLFVNEAIHILDSKEIEF